VDTVVGAAKPLPEGLKSAWMRRLVPSLRAQTTRTFPEESTAICGEEADWFGSDSVCGEVQLPVAVRVAYWTLKNDPSNRVQTA
jgi:hypothetical protein